MNADMLDIIDEIRPTLRQEALSAARLEARAQGLTGDDALDFIQQESLQGYRDLVATAREIALEIS